jgi:uncharacterized tellurite resistance protein B-like protein
MEELLHSVSYLFYAVAHADRHVDDEEKARIHEVVNENWKLLAAKGDPFGVHAMELIEKTVAALTEDDYDTEKALTLFRTSLVNHPELFTPEIKVFIQESCIRIANAFNRLNKAELVFLSRLEKILHGE